MNNASCIMAISETQTKDNTMFNLTITLPQASPMIFATILIMSATASSIWLAIVTHDIVKK